MVGVPSGVQDLHRDFAALGVHGIGHMLVFRSLSSSREFSRKRFNATHPIRRVATCDNQTDITPGTLGKVGRKTVVFVAVFEPCVHGAHKHAVLECRKSEIERGEEVRVLGID